MSSNKVLTVGLMSFVGDVRIEVEHPPGSSQWNLVIRDLRQDDAGVYECQISSRMRHASRHHVTLLVKGATFGGTGGGMGGGGGGGGGVSR